MNELGTLATEIVTYNFPDDTGRFPVTYISGWIGSRIGLINGLLHTDFVIESGDFVPNLCDVESGIVKYFYEIDYYNKASNEALRGMVWGGAGGFKDSITMVKEGDSVIQKVSKHQISQTFLQFAQDRRDQMNDLLFQYNNQKSAPIQVAGEDGNE